MGKTFNFLGDKLVISEERNIYNNIRKEFVNLAESLEKEFINIYRKENSNLDDVVQNTYKQGSDCIAEAITKAVEFLVKRGVYSIDEELFISEFYINYHIWDDVFGDIYDQYLEIQLKGEQLDAYRKARRTNRGRLIGGGFGLEGAAKGILVAGAVNAALGTVHGVVNGIGKLITSISNENKKNEIFNNPSTLNKLSSGIYQSVINVSYAIIDILNKETNLHFDYNPQQDMLKASNIFKNIKNHKLDSKTEIKLFKEILTLDPYNLEYYKYIISKYGDKDHDIERVAMHFYIRDIKIFKEQILEELLQTLPLDTEDNAKRAKNVIKENAEYYGVYNYEKLIYQIDIKLKEFDHQIRTVDGIAFATHEESEAANKELSELNILFKDFMSIDEVGLKELRDRLTDKSVFSTKVVERFIKRIDIRLKQLDIKARKVNETLMDARLETEKSKQEIVELEKVTVGLDKMDEKSLLELKSKETDKVHFSTNAVKTPIQRTDEQLDDLELNAGTVNGVISESKKDAIIQDQEDRLLSNISNNIENNTAITPNAGSENIIDKLIEICKSYKTTSYYVSESIPSKMINNAIASYNIPLSSKIIALVDGTIFKSAKNGLAICSDGLYWNSPNYKPKSEKQQLLWPEFKNANIAKGDFCIKFYDNILFNVTGRTYDAETIIKVLKDIQSFIIDFQLDKNSDI